MSGDGQLVRKLVSAAQEALPACPCRDREENASYSCRAAEGECVAHYDRRCCFFQKATAQEENSPFVVGLGRHGTQGCTGQACDRDASG